jgi:SAM-dependent methyltransferase
MADDDPTQRFYDELADVYHLVYANWEGSIAHQGVMLAGLLRERWRPAERVLDAACGIGTQALGLAAEGFMVVGSDISTAALTRAARESAARGVDIEWCRADLRSLSSVHRPGFDVVLACDNAIPHLLSAAEILGALREMRALTRPGGGCVISTRDYDATPRGGTQMIPYGVRETPAGRVAVFQVWDFVAAELYDLSMYFVHDLDARPRVQVFRSRYLAIGLAPLAELLREAGFVDVEVLTGRFFQPVLVGTNPPARNATP